MALRHDALLLIGKGIAIVPVFIGDLNQHKVFNVSGHGGLGNSNALFFQSFRQFFLCLNDLILDDFFNFHDSVSFHKSSPYLKSLSFPADWYHLYLQIYLYFYQF